MKKFFFYFALCFILFSISSCSSPFKQDPIVRLEIFKATPGTFISINSTSYSILDDPGMTLINFSKTDYPSIISIRLIAQICSDVEGVTSTIALYNLTDATSILNSEASTDKAFPNWQVVSSANIAEEIPNRTINICTQLKNDDGTTSANLVQAYLEIRM